MISLSGPITTSRTINFGIFIGGSFVSVFEKVTVLLLSRQRVSSKNQTLKYRLSSNSGNISIFLFFLAI